MPKAFWNGAMLAQSNLCKIIEGVYYFPPQSINDEYFRTSRRETNCSWKGIAQYYDITVDGDTIHDAAWCFPQPTEQMGIITNYVAFWKNVKVLD